MDFTESEPKPTAVETVPMRAKSSTLPDKKMADQHKIKAIQSLIAGHFRLDASIFGARAKASRYKEPYAIAYWLAREITGRGYQFIGHNFGGRSMSPAQKAIWKLQQLIAQAPNEPMALICLKLKQNFLETYQPPECSDDFETAEAGQRLIPLTSRRIKQVICEHYPGTTANLWESGERDRASVEVRAISYYLAYTVANKPMKWIRQDFGARAYITVRNGIQNITHRVESDPNGRVAQTVRELVMKLEQLDVPLTNGNSATPDTLNTGALVVAALPAKTETERSLHALFKDLAQSFASDKPEAIPKIFVYAATAICKHPAPTVSAYLGLDAKAYANARQAIFSRIDKDQGFARQLRRAARPHIPPRYGDELAVGFPI